MKICAECLTEDVATKYMAVEAIYRLADDGSVIKDGDAIDLLEWAAVGLISDDEFPETFGPLRVRTVKAAPKDVKVARRCFESCLLHWDLVSAQQVGSFQPDRMLALCIDMGQIAALLDRNFQQERRYLFWNIVVTHMLSVCTWLGSKCSGVRR